MPENPISSSPSAQKDPVTYSPTLLSGGAFKFRYPLIHQLVNDSLDFDFHSLDDAEISFIHAIHLNNKPPMMDANISEHDLKAMFQATDELTPSSPSGRHYGLYKAMVQQPSLLRLHTILTTIPFQYGFILQHWKMVTQVMLKKAAMDRQVEDY